MLWQLAIISHNSWFWGDYCSHKPFYKNWQLGKQCKKIRWYLEVLSLIFYQSVMEFLASKKCWRGNLRLKLQIMSQESEAWASWQSERFDYFEVTDIFCLLFFSVKYTVSFFFISSQLFAHLFTLSGFFPFPFEMRPHFWYSSFRPRALFTNEPGISLLSTYMTYITEDISDPYEIRQRGASLSLRNKKSAHWNCGKAWEDEQLRIQSQLKWH